MSLSHPGRSHQELGGSATFERLIAAITLLLCRCPRQLMWCAV